MEIQRLPLSALRERECEIMQQLNQALMSAALRWGYADPPGAELRAAVEQAQLQLAEVDAAYANSEKVKAQLARRSKKPNPFGPGYDLGPPNKHR
jgi:hypothetical protein